MRVLAALEFLKLPLGLFLLRDERVFLILKLLLGLALASLGLRALVNTGLSAYRDLQSATLDWTVLGFGIAVSLATALVFGILPALQLSRTDVRDAMRDSGRTIADPAPQGLRGAFVVAQVALAFVLLVGTGLLVRSLVRLNAVETGSPSTLPVTRAVCGPP